MVEQEIQYIKHDFQGNELSLKLGYWHKDPYPDDSDSFWVKFESVITSRILMDGDIVYQWMQIENPLEEGTFETVGCYNTISNVSVAKMSDFGVQTFYGTEPFAIDDPPETLSFTMQS